MDRSIKLFLGSVAFIADIIGILTFIFSGQAVQFWSATWIVMLVSIGLLLAFSLLFFSSAGGKPKEEFFPIVACAYAVMSGLAVLTGLFFLGRSQVNFGQFLGIFVLIIFPAVMAMVVSEVAGKRANKPILYVYATTGLLAVIGLMHRYMQNPGFSLALAGEIVILVSVGILFYMFSDSL